MKIDAVSWTKLESHEKKILLQTAMIFPPISLDILFHTLSSPPTAILKALEKFSTFGILKPCKQKGTGFYSFPDKNTVLQILKHASRQQMAADAAVLIDYFYDTWDETPDKWLQIAHFYAISRIPIRHAATVLKAAEHCMHTNNLKDAFAYHHLLISNFPRNPEKKEEKELYIKAAVGLCANSEDMLPLSTQEQIMTRALDYIEAQSHPTLHVQALIFKARCMMRQGDFNGADVFYAKGLEIASHFNDPSLKKWIFVFKSDIEIWGGRIQSAIHHYEKLVGKLEAFPSNALFLKAYARLGWSYGICGDIYRGLGLVNVVHKKALDYKIKYIEIYAELMKLMILTDTRRIKEARASLDIILNYPACELDHYVLWAAHGKRAYFACLENDLETAYQAYRESVTHSNALECPHYHGTDILEYLHAFEKAGLEDNILQNEFQKIMDWPDIYTRGAALRYRAMYAMAEGNNKVDIKKDLEQSLVLLKTAGATVELTQTRIVLAKFLLSRDNDDTRARQLLKAAWESASTINAAMFPDVLKPYVETDDEEALLVDTIVEVGNTLSGTRDRFKLLSSTIELIIRLVGAERGGIFLLDKNGDVKLESSRNLEVGTVEQARFKFSSDVILKVINTGKESVSFGKFASLIITGQIRENGWVICYPIALRDKISGALYVDNSFSSMRLPRHKLPLLKAIGNQIAIALDNVEAYEKITRLQYRLEAETHFYRKESHKPEWAGHIVGESPGIRNVLDIIKEVAPSDATVLINGETGVGKELAARAIHTISKRSEGPFIPINIATISPALVYSELFGHTRGSFTGAHADHVGRFELANGGSFFMDDVDGLSLKIQVKLLRVLESREFQRVGDNKLITSDFRLIAATNQDLSLLVRRGKFRSDFFYRLNVVPITIPPLRKRKEDIPLLATHFSNIFSKKLGKATPVISSSNMDRLMHYAWPGNVRELSHYIERAVILTRGSRLRLPRHDQTASEHMEDTTFAGLDEMIRNHIREALKKCNWKVSGKNGAAALLKMNPQTLYSKIHKLKITKT